MTSRNEFTYCCRFLFPRTPFRAYISRAMAHCAVGPGAGRNVVLFQSVAKNVAAVFFKINGLHGVTKERRSQRRNGFRCRSMACIPSATLRRLLIPPYTHARARAHMRDLCVASVAASQSSIIYLKIKNNHCDAGCDALRRFTKIVSQPTPNLLKNNKKGGFYAAY